MSLQCFYQLGVIAYYNINREYIAEALCINKKKSMEVCHGQCFLKKNLNLTAESTSDSKDAPSTRQQVEFPLFLVSELNYQFDVASKIMDRNFQYSQEESVGHSRTPFRPPSFFA
jgi:hypothetical protein